MYTCTDTRALTTHTCVHTQFHVPSQEAQGAPRVPSACSVCPRWAACALSARPGEPGLPPARPRLSSPGTGTGPGDDLTQFLFLKLLASLADDPRRHFIGRESTSFIIQTGTRLRAKQGVSVASRAERGRGRPASRRSGAWGPRGAGGGKRPPPKEQAPRSHLPPHTHLLRYPLPGRPLGPALAACRAQPCVLGREGEMPPLGVTSAHEASPGCLGNSAAPWGALGKVRRLLRLQGGRPGSTLTCWCPARRPQL